MQIKAFQKKVWDFYKKNKRKLPWRETKDPYRIWVSEIMLQQTQVDRVIPKYNAFLKKFPTIEKLASAKQSDVLLLWSGLGYNRRALLLKRAAETVVRDHKGKIPKEVTELEKLPGIGPYTARAIATFSYNQPHAFIETNIRSVFIREFFPKSKNVSDTKLFPLIEKTLDAKNAREWGYALMDYGSYLKKEFGNPNTKSKQYTKQSKFTGSDRQIRGAIIKTILTEKNITKKKLYQLLSRYEEKRINAQLQALTEEGFVVCKGEKVAVLENRK